MDQLINIVQDEMLGWEQESSQTNRYSVFTEHLILAEKIRTHQHLIPEASPRSEDDEESFHTAASTPSRNKRNDVSSIPLVGRLPSYPTAAPNSSLTTSPPSSKQVNTRRTRTNGPRASKSPALSGEWTWRPFVPQRTSSMGARGKKGNSSEQPSLVTFHRRSCQIFSSLDSTISNAVSTSTNLTNDSCTSTAPSLASSIDTQTTSIFDDSWYQTPSSPSLHLELLDPRLSTQSERRPGPDFINFLDAIDERPRLHMKRSSSQLSPHVTSTEQVFWTSDETRQAEYAKIDASHGGFKGLIKRIVPHRWGWAHSKRRNFHQPPCPTMIEKSSPADDDSIRRFRLSIDSITHDAILNAELHGVSTGANTPVLPSSPNRSQPETLEEAPSDSAQVMETKETPRARQKPSMTKPADNVTKFFRGISSALDKEQRVKASSRKRGH